MTAHDPSLTDAAFRASVVGASEVAALFDTSPWLTRFELFHRKAGTIDTPKFNAVIDGKPENERVYFGVKLEPIVIEAACERWGYVPAETPKRLTNGKGLGGHPDKLVDCPDRGMGVLEVKTADWLVVKKWGDDLRRNNRAVELAVDFMAAKARAKVAEKEAEAAKVELLEIIGTAGTATLDGYRVSCGMTKGNPGTVITTEHIGQIINKRAGYRRFDVKEAA